MQVLRWLPLAASQLLVDASSSLNSDPAGQKQLGSLPLSHEGHPRNYAAFIPSELAQLEVSEAQYPSCGDDELIIKNYAAAVNPVDWKVQSSSGRFNLKYPTILGEDVAGEVLEIGGNLKNAFHVGQRVMSHTMGLGKGSAYGGFQLYPLLTAATTSPIPDELPYSEAAVLPLSISTAAAGLFMNATLGLEFPKANAQLQMSSRTSKEAPAILLWGGSSSVGSSVIQLASAAGYTVITTASPAQHLYCKDLGATDVLDYHDPKITSQLIKLLEGRKVVGAYDAIGSDVTVHQCATILHALGGGKIASVGLTPEMPFPDVTVAGMSSGRIVTDEPNVAREIWGKYVPSALESGRLIASPKSLVVGTGLANVQKGLDRQKEGVSAQKVVVLFS